MYALYLLNIMYIEFLLHTIFFCITLMMEVHSENLVLFLSLNYMCEHDVK